MTAAPAAVRAAPAWVWQLAAGIALAVALLLVFADRLWPAMARQAAAQQLHLERLDQPAGGRPQVVALGDSKLRFAVLHDRAFSTPDHGAALDVDFVRISRDGARTADMAPALERLCRQPPALLLLQADFLIWRRGSAAATGFDPLLHWRENVRRLRAWWGHRQRPAGAENLGLPADWQQHGSSLGALPRDYLRRRYQRSVRHWRPPLAEDLQVWESTLDCLRRQGTAIVVLPIPRAPFAQALLPEALAAHERERLAQLAADPDRLVWATPLAFADDDFHDEGHMAEAAQRRYSDWLREAL